MSLYITPYRRMAMLRQAMDRIYEENFTDANPGEREMLLAVDVRADDEAFEIEALVPGLEAEDLEIEILNNTVAIRGEFKSELKEEAKSLMCELPAGKFSRLVTLPTALDPAKTKATIKNGVLNLRVPKAESHQPKAIKVTTM
jgi:HSP20 family protein